VVNLGSSLRIAAWDKKDQSNIFLGQVKVPITKLKVEEKMDSWFPFQPRRPTEVVNGEIRLALLWNPLNEVIEKCPSSSHRSIFFF